MELEDFLVHAGELTPNELEHHGVKGMHWGVRRHSSSDNAGKAQAHLARAKEHEETAKALIQGVENLKTHQADLAVNGEHSEIFKKAYGEKAGTESGVKFLFRTGMNKGEALELTRTSLVNQRNANIRAINRHAKKAAKHREKAAKLA